MDTKKIYEFLGKDVKRVDGAAKVRGKHDFPSDIYFPNMMYLRAVRANRAHAKIISIDISLALELKDVITVLTYKDVPGLNAYGISSQDQPVLCEDKVRYVGDVVALICGENQDVLDKAENLIDVQYKDLKVYDDMFSIVDEFKKNGENKKKPNKIHKKGDVLRFHEFNVGSVPKMEKSELVEVKSKIQTQAMKHLFLETEAGVSFYDGDILTVIAGGQYPHRDEQQISRSINISQDKLRVINPALGGAFGGKDEITVQILLALATLKTKRPAKLFLSRHESMISGYNRHPMYFNMKTTADKSGNLISNKVEIVSNSGAYATLSGPVLNLAMEHACGAYKVPKYDVKAYCVYTNEGYNGAYRGFGATQAIVAIESQMDMLAHKLKIDPVEFRLKNALKKGDKAGLGYTMTTDVGIVSVLEAMQSSELYKNIDLYKKTSSKHIKRGIGVACAMQGLGLGRGLPDVARATIRIAEDRKYELMLGAVDLGQGNTTVFAQIVAEVLGCNIDKINISMGDSKNLDTGPTTATRTIYAVGNAVLNAVKKLKEKLKEHGLSDEKIRRPYELPSDIINISVDAEFKVPLAELELGDGLPHILYSYAGHIVLVEVDTRTCKIKPLRVESYIDAGKVMNPLGLAGQAYGGAVMGLAYALMEEFKFKDAIPQNTSLANYQIPNSMDMPLSMKNIFIEYPETTGPYGAKGVGEVVTVPIAPAALNAFHDATGVRAYEMPLTPEKVYELIHKKRK